MQNIANKNCSNGPINTGVNSIGSKIWDIVQLTKFKTKSKSMPLFIPK